MTTDGPNVAPEVTAAPAASAAPAQPPQAGWKSFTLPISGKPAKVMTKPLGEHMKKAAAISGRDQSMVPYALAAVTCLVDGAPLTAEEILQLDLADASTLTGQAMLPLGLINLS